MKVIEQEEQLIEKRHKRLLVGIFENEEIRLPIPVTLNTTPNTIPSLDIDRPRRIQTYVSSHKGYIFVQHVYHVRRDNNPFKSRDN